MKPWVGKPAPFLLPLTQSVQLPSSPAREGNKGTLPRCVGPGTECGPGLWATGSCLTVCPLWWSHSVSQGVEWPATEQCVPKTHNPDTTKRTSLPRRSRVLLCISVVRDSRGLAALSFLGTSRLGMCLSLCPGLPALKPTCKQ